MTRLGSHSYIWLQGLALVAIFYFALRAYLSPVRDLGIEDLMLIIPASSLYLVAGYALTGKDGIKIRQGLAITVILLLALHVLYCLFQFNGVEGYSLARYFEGSTRSSSKQVTGMYGYYGSFANFAVIAGFLCLSLGVWGRLTFAVRGAVFFNGDDGVRLSYMVTIKICGTQFGPSPHCIYSNAYSFL